MSRRLPPLALVFDMDGTILDNMAFHTEAWMRTIADLGRPPVDPVAWERQTSGVPNREIFRGLLALDLDDAGIEHWVQHKERLYRECSAGRVVAIDGFTAFLDRAVTANIKVGLATGAGPENIAYNLDALGIRHRFDTIVGAADVRRGKPDPEIFRTAANRLGIQGSQQRRVVVFEDAPLGIQAASAAHMEVVGVSTMLTADELGSLPGVRRVIDRYVDVDPLELFDRAGFRTRTSDTNG